MKLRVNRVRSSSRLTGSLSPGEAKDYGEFGGEILVVEDSSVGEELANYHNVEVVSKDANPGVTASESEETYYCGVNGCSRTVDNPEDTCWQHEVE